VKPTYFATAAGFRSWLEVHHAKATEIVLGFYNKASGRGGITYPEALDEALCFGWIDGVRKRIDEHGYSIRFTPRKSVSIWSLVNVRHYERLAKLGRVRSAGQAAYERRDPKKTGVYSFENRPKKLPTAMEKMFRTNQKAWAFWQTQPPGYQRLTIWWVMSAKQSQTQQRRLASLITKSANEVRVF